MRQLQIDGTLINDDSDCYVIAEIGNNHQGDLETAKAMVRAAKLCGADAVKLQKRSNRALYTAEYYNRLYDNPNSFGRTYGEHRELLEFGEAEYTELKRFCGEVGITLFAAAFDFESADFLARFDMPAFKVASGDLRNIPLIEHLARFGKPLIVSTGGATLEDIERVYEAVMPINPQLCFLQCTASYPTPAEEINLQVIQTLRTRFPELVIGLSDHYNGILSGPVAYLFGARVIEKHFTLNRAAKGTDHAFSLEPIGLQKLVRDLRRVRLMIGDGVKEPFPTEAEPLLKMGKKLVAARDLMPGHRITRDDVAIKCPGDGLPPFELDRLIGRRLRHPIKADAAFHPDMLDGTATEPRRVVSLSGNVRVVAGE